MRLAAATPPMVACFGAGWVEGKQLAVGADRFLQRGERHSRLDRDGEVVGVVFHYLVEASEREEQADGRGDAAEVEMLAGAAGENGEAVGAGDLEQFRDFLFRAGCATAKGIWSSIV